MSSRPSHCSIMMLLTAKRRCEALGDILARRWMTLSILLRTVSCRRWPRSWTSRFPASLPRCPVSAEPRGFTSLVQSCHTSLAWELAWHTCNLCSCQDLRLHVPSLSLSFARSLALSPSLPPSLSPSLPPSLPPSLSPSLLPLSLSLSRSPDRWAHQGSADAAQLGYPSAAALRFFSADEESPSASTGSDDWDAIRWDGTLVDSLPRRQRYRLQCALSYLGEKGSLL
jgi:hypothetical protein